MNRREMLGGMLAVGGVVASSVFIADKVKKEGKMGRFEQQGGDFSWTPQRLDLDEVATLAHEAFHYKGYG